MSSDSFSSPNEGHSRFIVFRKALEVVAVTLGLALFSLPVFSQLNLGRIFGAITDQSGGALVGATVTVLDEARGVSRPLVTNGDGEYDAPSLTPGTYTVRAEAKGFKVAEHTGIEVGVGKEISVDLMLQPGEQNQTITVTGDLPMVNTANAELGGTLQQAQVNELPVEGRNYQYLIGTQPGMIMVPSQGQFPYISNGVRNSMETWMVDGLLNTNALVGGPSLVGGGTQQGDQGNILPLDAVQEVQMIENPNAVYGDKPGAHVNVGLKSGTNNLHGSLFAYGKDGAWAAKNPFLAQQTGLPAVPKQTLGYEQFGASLGGPIKKDKVFYFSSYEGARYNAGQPQLALEPTTASGAGVQNSIPDAIYDILHTGGAPPPSALSFNMAGCGALVQAVGGVNSGNFSAAQVAQPQNAARFPNSAAIARDCSAATSLFGNGGPTQSEPLDLLAHGGSDNGIIKVDVHANDKNSLNFEWFSGGGDLISPGMVVQSYWDTQTHDWANLGRAVWVWTPNSTWLNEFRFGYDYGSLPAYDLECDKPGIGPNYATAYGFDAGTPPCTSSILSPGKDVLGGFPLISVGAFTQLGATNGFTQDGNQQYWTYLDNASWTHGKHTVTFGFENRFLRFQGDALIFGKGLINFLGGNPLEAFLEGQAAFGLLLDGSSYVDIRRPSYAAYVQDVWRVLPRVTVNAGLRWEYSGVIKEANDKIGNFDPSQSLTADPTGLIQEGSSKNIYKPYPWNFGPRLGAAWDVSGNGKTVVHAGGGVLFDAQPYLLTVLFSGIVNSIPTGFTFAENGHVFQGPGTIANGFLNPIGPGFGGNELPWTVGSPVFNTAPGALACGDGNTPIPSQPAGTAPPGPCSIDPYNLLNRYPYYTTWTLGVQHSFSNNLSLTVAYVGDQGNRLDSNLNINAPTPGLAGGAETAREPFSARYPFYGTIGYESDAEESSYNGLQVLLIQRVSHGLNFTAGYTFSHTLDDSTCCMNNYNPLIDYGNSGMNVPSTFNFTATYLIPGIKTPGEMLEGWQLNTSVYLLGGFSTNVDDTGSDLSGTNGGGSGSLRWTMSKGGNPHDFKIGGPGPQVPCYGVIGSGPNTFANFPNCTGVANVSAMPALCVTTAAAEATNPTVVAAGDPNATGLDALGNYGCYLEGKTAIVPPAQGTFGTMPVNALYDKPYNDWDFSLSKNWKFGERYGVQFRAEFFNLLNRTLYNAPSATSLTAAGNFGESTSTPDVLNPVIGNGPRKVQLGLRFTF